MPLRNIIVTRAHSVKQLVQFFSSGQSVYCRGRAGSVCGIGRCWFPVRPTRHTATVRRQKKDDVRTGKRNTRPEERGIAHSYPTPDERKADDYDNNRHPVEMWPHYSPSLPEARLLVQTDATQIPSVVRGQASQSMVMCCRFLET